MSTGRASRRVGVNFLLLHSPPRRALTVALLIPLGRKEVHICSVHLTLGGGRGRPIQDPTPRTLPPRTPPQAPLPPLTFFPTPPQDPSPLFQATMVHIPFPLEARPALLFLDALHLILTDRRDRGSLKGRAELAGGAADIGVVTPYNGQVWTVIGVKPVV